MFITANPYFSPFLSNTEKTSQEKKFKVCEDIEKSN